MTNKSNKTKLITMLALTAAAGVVAYAFFKTYKSVEDLGELEFDYGNDDALLSLCKIKNRMRDK